MQGAENDPSRKALSRAHFDMIRDMQHVILVLDYIHSKMDIPKVTREKIKAEKDRSDQVRELLSLVETLGDRGYDSFRDALLATGQPHLAKILPACGKIRFLLPNVSMLQEGVPHVSDKIRMAGTSWHTVVQVSEAHGSKGVRAFIYLEPRDLGGKRFLVNFELSLVRQNPIRGMENITKGGCIIFPDPADETKDSMGRDLLSYASLIDPENGWLQNDSMLVLASLEIEKIGLGERIEDSMTFVLNGVREMMPDPLYESEPKVVCDVRWKIGLRAYEKEGTYYLAVGIMGEKEDFNGRRYYLAHQSTLVRQSGSQPNMVDERSCVVPDPWDGSTDSAKQTFIPFDLLIDPQHGWLKNNNSLEVRCDFILWKLEESD